MHVLDLDVKNLVFTNLFEHFLQQRKLGLAVGLALKALVLKEVNGYILLELREVREVRLEHFPVVAARSLEVKIVENDEPLVFRQMHIALNHVYTVLFSF